MWTYEIGPFQARSISRVTNAFDERVIVGIQDPVERNTLLLEMRLQARNTVICPGDAVPPILSMLGPSLPSARSGPGKCVHRNGPHHRRRLAS